MCRGGREVHSEEWWKVIVKLEKAGIMNRLINSPWRYLIIMIVLPPIWTGYIYLIHSISPPVGGFIVPLSWILIFFLLVSYAVADLLPHVIGFFTNLMAELNSAHRKAFGGDQTTERKTPPSNPS